MIVEIEVETMAEALALQTLFPSSQVQDDTLDVAEFGPVGDLSPQEALLRIRGNIGMTQAQLARVSGVTSRTISSFENGSLWPRAGTLGKLENALGLYPGYFHDLAKSAE